MHRSIWALTFIAAGALVGCGGTEIPTTSVSGSVDGASITGTAQAFYKVESNGTFKGDNLLILISNDANACNDLALVGAGRSGVSDGAGGRRPSLLLSTDKSELTTKARDVGDDLIAHFDPGTGATTTACSPDGGGAAGCASNGDITAESGTAHIERADDVTDKNAVAEGTFDLKFGGQSVAGTFHATPCTTLNGGCGAIAGGPALLPMLALLAFRRQRRRIH